MKVICVGFVGAPHSGKTSLVNYLKVSLKSKYRVIIADEPPTTLLRLGYDPDDLFEPIEFQAECLKEYTRIQDRVSHMIQSIFARSVLKESEKDIVVLMDTLPSIGKCYLDDSQLDAWRAFYNSYYLSAPGDKLNPDIVFNLELVQGEFSTKGNVARREFDVDSILEIEDKINKSYYSAISLSNELSLEERASIVEDKIDDLLSI